MKFALLVFYAAGTLAAPVLDERYPKVDINIVECTGTRFAPGTTFEYEYEGETLHKVEGTSKKTTGLQLSARVFITQLKGCNFNLKLSNVELRSKSMDQHSFAVNAESAAVKESLQRNDIRFTMEGNTVTSVMPHESETLEALNIKRGIISTIQLDETKATEADVNGRCKTEITMEGQLVIKSKALSECSERTMEQIGIQSSSINTGSNLKPLDSKSKCTYTLDSGKITNVVCEESHLFRPFSAGYEKSSGAMTLVKQEMRLNQNTPAPNMQLTPHGFTSTKTLIFDHAREDTETADTMHAAVNEVMGRLVNANQLSTQQQSAEEFVSLVRMFRVLDHKSMSRVWDQYFDCIASQTCAPTDHNMKDLYRQYMLDAIAYCGTPTCVSVVKDVTISGEIAGERANMFLGSIALLAKTTNGMIRDILDIAERKPSRQVFLTLGTLISRHCTQSPHECNSNTANAIVEAENFLVRTLGDCSDQDNHERVEEILLTLKAIGNAKRPMSAQSAIIRCALNSKHSNITMSAFDALRGMPCEESTLEGLRNFISNENIDADKRIYAFQASMKCGTKKDNLEKLVHQYNMETNKQVASFMWTYFTNIMESSDPDNKMAKTLLREIEAETPLKETNLPMYQYSKHFEKSLFIDSIRTGATAKADLVFHPDKFLPSTAVFDMTAKVMGVPVDLVQTAVGIDGMETLIENVFGPGGSMPKEFVLNMFNWTVTSEKLRDMAAREDANNRERRSLRRDEMPMVNDIHETINKKPTQPSGFMSLKVMGQEVRIMSYDDIYAMIDQIDNMNVIQLLLNIAKGGQKTFSKSVMFLEMVHSVPTGLGLPLKLKLAGSTVGTVDMSGKFDIRNMFWGPGALTINGFVKPSAVVEIQGQLSTESKFISTGLRVSSNMMVSNMLKGSIIYKEGNILKINLDTPTEPEQLFKVSSTPFMFLNQHAKVIEGTLRMIEKDACLKSQLIGYGMCTSIRMPMAFRDYEAPYFPFTGPAHFGVSVVRGDERLTTFQFLTTMTKQGNGFEGVVEFSTPNAAYERKLSAKMAYSDTNNDKVLTLSTEPLGRTGALKFTYNTLSHKTTLETKNNFFTPKEIITRIVLFNQKNPTYRQLGVELTAEYDWYKFQHVVKYVNRDNSYMLESHTEYAPQKSITAAVELNTFEKKVRAIMDVNQVRQAVELIGKLESTKNEKGVTLMLVHVPTDKKATFYTGYKVEENKREIMTSVNVMGRSMKNILGWYKNGDIQSIEDFLKIEGKTARFGASWEDRNNERALQFSADIFGKKAMSTVIYSGKDDQNTIDLSTRILGKEVSSTVLLTNRMNEKSLKIMLNSAEKPAEWSIGYYNENKMITLMTAARGFGNNAGLFWTLDKTNQYKSSVGFELNQYVGGFRGEVGDRTSCLSLFYRKPTFAEKTAIKTCVEYTKTQKEQLTQRQLAYWIHIPELNKKISVDTEVSKEVGRTNMVSKVLYNDAVINTKTLDLVYKGLSDTAIAFGINNKLFRGGMKFYSQKASTGEEIDIGFQMNAIENSILFLHKYNPSLSKIASSVVVNNKVLPVTTDITYEKTDVSFKPTFKINVGEYGLGQACDVWYGADKYGALCKMAITKGEQSLLGLLSENVVEISGSNIALVQNFGFTLSDKKYIYGWQLSYDNKSKDDTRIHELALKIKYSTTRWSTLTFTLADNGNLARFTVGVEYIPTKKVHHSITYSKHRQQLDISIELLPAVFAKLWTRLESKNGFRLITDARIECKDCGWSGLTMINSYINNDKEFMISTSFAPDLSIGLKIAKTTPTSLTLFANAFGKNVQFKVLYENMKVEVGLTVNEKKLFKFTVTYDQLTATFRMLAAKQERVIFDVTSGYNKLMKAFKLAFVGVGKWGGVYANTKGKITNIYFELLGKSFAKVVFNKKDMFLSIKSLQYPKFSLDFKIIPKSKTLAMSVKTTSSRLTFSVRADWQKKIAALIGLFNKQKAELKFLFSKNTVIVKVPLPSAQILKATISIVDNSLKMTLQRITKGKVTNEDVFKYSLSNKFSEVMLKWNTEIITKIEGLLRSLIEKAVKDVKELAGKIKNHDLKLIQISNEVKAKILQFVSKLDKAIGEFDIIPAREYIYSSAINAWIKLSELTRELLTTLVTGLDKIKTGTPETMQKLRELIKRVKAMYVKFADNMEMKTEVIIAKAKLILEMLEKIVENGKELVMTGIKEGKDLVMKGNGMLKAISVKIEQKLIPIMKLVRNISDSTRPVVETFIKLAKDFKIRGKRMEDIVIMATSEGRQLLNFYIETVKVILTRFEVEGMLKLKEVRTRTMEIFNRLKIEVVAILSDVLESKVPYFDMTIPQLIKKIEVEVTKFVEWVKSLDVKEVMDAATINTKKWIKAKSTMFKTQLVEIVNKLDKSRRYAPELARDILDKVLAILNRYTKDIDMVMNQMSVFIKPLKDYLNVVEISINKHFGPVFDMTRAMIKVELERIYELIKPFVPLYNNLVGQIRQLKVVGTRVGTVVDKKLYAINMEMDGLVSKIKQELKTLNAKSTNEVITTSVKMLKEIVEYIKVVFRNRYEDVEKMANVAYKKLDSQYKTITAKSFEEVTDEVLKLSSDGIVMTAEELSTLVKQLIAMDISEPMWKAMHDADVLGRLEKYQIPEKIRTVIKYVKRTNLTRTVLKTIATIQDLINLGVKKSSMAALEMFSKTEMVYKYLKSIPKKDYETWLNELAHFTYSTSGVVERNLRKVLDTLSKEANKATVLLDEMKKIDIDRYKNILYEKYSIMEKLITLIAEKSTLVYSDIKQPTINLYMNYRDVIIAFIENHYLALKTRFLTEYEKISAEVGIIFDKLMTELKSMLFNLELRAMKTYDVIVSKYNTFRSKYGDMTWEEVANKIKTAGLKEFGKIRGTIDEIVTKVAALKAKVETKVTEMYELTAMEYKKIVNTLEFQFEILKAQLIGKFDEIKATLIEYYNKYEKLYKTYEKLIKREIVVLKMHARTMYEDVKRKTTELYNMNKDKTLKQIYIQIKQIITDAYLKQKEILKAISENNLAKAKELLRETQAKVMSEYGKVITAVIPELTDNIRKFTLDNPQLLAVMTELMTEAESIINQTLRNTVIMAKVIIKAYTPHVTLVRNYIDVLRVQLPVSIAKLKEFVKISIEKIMELYKQCRANCEKRMIELVAKVQKLVKMGIEECKKINNVIAIIMKNEYYVKYAAILQQKLIQLQKMIVGTLRELNLNPTVIKIKTTIKEKFIALKEILEEELDNILSNPQFIEVRRKVEKVISDIKAFIEAKIIEARLIIAIRTSEVTRFVELNVAERREFVEQKLNEIDWLVQVTTTDINKRYVLPTIALLKQLETSLRFTVEKLRMYATPYLIDAMETTLEYFKGVPQLVKEANRYFFESPEDSFWYGVEVAKEALAGAYLHARTITAQGIQKDLLEFYQNVAVIGQELIVKCTDEWTKKTALMLHNFIGQMLTKITTTCTKLIKQCKTLPAFLKAYYEKKVAILKDLVNTEFASLKFLVYRQYADLEIFLKDTSVFLIDFVNTMFKNIRDTCPFKTILGSKIWEEITDEVKNHELTILAQEVKEMVTTRIVEFKKELVIRIEKIIKTQKDIFMKQYAVLKEKADILISKLKTKGLELFKNGMERMNLLIVNVKESYDWIKEKARQTFEETTISEIVAFIQEQWKEALKIIDEVSEKIDEVKVKYLKKLEAIYEEYKTILSKLTLRDIVQMAQTEGMALVERIMVMVQPYWENINKVITTEWEKVSAFAIAKYKKLSAFLIEKYGKYFTEVIAKYKKFSDVMITQVEKLSADVIVQYKVLLKWVKEMTTKTMDLYKKYEMRAIKAWEKLAGQLEGWVQWIELGINTFKKMTIKDTIKELKRIPAVLETYSGVKLNELVQFLKLVKTNLVIEYLNVIAKVEEVYKMLKEQFQSEKVQKYIRELQSVMDQVMKMLPAYIANIKVTYYYLENEVLETITFVDKYYKDFIIAEIMKIIDALKRSFPTIVEAMKSYGEDYKLSAIKYADKYQRLLKTYAKDAEDFTRTSSVRVRRATLNTGDDILRGIHSALVFIDNFDTEDIVNKLRNIVSIIKEHVTIIKTKGLLIARLNHPDIKPVINYYTNVVKDTARKTMKQLKMKGKEVLAKIETELPALKEKIRRLKSKIREAVMESTFEIRRDLNISFKVNKNIAIRIYDVVSRLVEQKLGKYEVLKEKVLTMLTKGKQMSEAYLTQLMTILEDVYGKVETIMTDISNSASPKDIYVKIINYINDAIRVLETEYTPLVAPTLAKLKTELSSLLKTMKSNYEVLKENSQEVTMQELEKSFILAKKFFADTKERVIKFASVAYDQLRAGVDTPNINFERLVSFTQEELTKILNDLKEIRGKLCNENTELCRLIEEGLEVQKILLEKYIQRIASYLTVGKAHVDRAIRKINTATKDKHVGRQYLATAMIMGNHILTFDNKFYDLVDFQKTKKGGRSSCSYLLARDFQDKKFTLSKIDNAIIVETPDMSIKIRDDGQTRTTIGNKISFSLPVESESSKCIRLDNLILCHFKDQRMKITVDLKNFFTTISISGWYKGKSQGLLGTYNNEVHDDWRLPNNKIATNVNEFANAYELSGSPECKLKLETENTKVCKGKASKMCVDFFGSDRSPFANVFNVADPKPFLEACIQDTKCKKVNKKSHCSIVAAYVALLRTKGVWVPQLKGCMTEKGHLINEEWIQKSSKAIDVVVMVSQHNNMLTQRKSVSTTLKNLHKLLKQGKYNVRYALIGFGGAGVHEPAHSHPLRRSGQSVFGYGIDLGREIKAMSFKGDTETTNDGYHAILLASRLKFRPAAEKVFIMFNSAPHSSHETGPSFDETKYILAREANAPLFVFDTVKFQKYGESTGTVIGQTERKLYTSTNLKGVTSKDLVLPASEFKQLILLSKGALFSNDIKSPEDTAVSLHDAVLNWVKTDMALCKRCTLRGSWTGQPRPICISDRTASC